MAAAVKFLAPNSKRPALAVLGRTKLFELLDESEHDLEALADGGTVAGLNLDEISSMSSRELREALVEARKTAAAKDKVIAKKDAKLNELAEREEVRRNGSMTEREKQQIDDLRDAGIECEHALLRLVACVDGTTREPATEAAEVAARQTLEYVVQRLADACGEAGIAVEVLGERVEPGWLRPITDALEQAATRKARR